MKKSEIVLLALLLAVSIPLGWSAIQAEQRDTLRRFAHDEQVRYEQMKSMQRDTELMSLAISNAAITNTWLTEKERVAYLDLARTYARTDWLRGCDFRFTKRLESMGK